MRRKSKYRVTVSMLFICIMINPMVLEARGFGAASMSEDLSLLDLAVAGLISEVVNCINCFIKYKKGDCKSSTFIKHFVVVDVLALLLLIYYYIKVL